MARARAIDPSTGPEDLQLSLFSDVLDGPPVVTLEKESTHGNDGRPDTARSSDSGALEQIPAPDGPGVDVPETTPSGDLRSTGIDEQSAVRASGDPEDGIPDRLGAGDQGVGISSGRGGSAPVILRSGDSRPQTTLARDFRIIDADRVGQGSLKETAQANLAAIRTLKRVEAEDRPATPEEKSKLVKYTGWGAMPGAFERQPSRDWKAIAD